MLQVTASAEVVYQPRVIYMLADGLRRGIITDQNWSHRITGDGL